MTLAVHLDEAVCKPGNHIITVTINRTAWVIFAGKSFMLRRDMECGMV